MWQWFLWHCGVIVEFHPSFLSYAHRQNMWGSGKGFFSHSGAGGLGISFGQILAQNKTDSQLLPSFFVVCLFFAKKFTWLILQKQSCRVEGSHLSGEELEVEDGDSIAQGPQQRWCGQSWGAGHGLTATPIPFPHPWVLPTCSEQHCYLLGPKLSLLQRSCHYKGKQLAFAITKSYKCNINLE